MYNNLHYNQMTPALSLCRSVWKPSSLNGCATIGSCLTALFPPQTRAAERREAAHGGQRHIPRTETQDITGGTNNSHASHDYRLLRHQEHQRVRLQEITPSVVVAAMLASPPGSATILSQSLTKQGNSSLLLFFIIFFNCLHGKLNNYCDLTMLKTSPRQNARVHSFH